MNKCLVCESRTDAFACKPCSLALQKRLCDIGELLSPQLLDQKRAGIRAISYTGNGGKSAGETPLPFNPRVGEAEQVAYGTLFSIWQELVTDEPSLHDLVPQNANASQLAFWLAAQVMDHLRWMESIDEYCSDVAEKHRAVLRLWDNPPEQTFIGTCGHEGELGSCPEALYADKGALATKCRRCKTEHDVQERYASLVARCDDHLATLKEIAQFLAPVHGERVRLRKLNYFIEQGRLAPRDSRPDWMADGSIRRTNVFRIGDVEALIQENIAAEKERAEKRAKKKVA